VEQCIAGAVRSWEFPRVPGGGIVIVSYPFVLKAEGVAVHERTRLEEAMVRISAIVIGGIAAS
jgi:hypothetical protein